MLGTDAVLKTTALGKGQTVVSEEELQEKHVNRTGENIELLQLEQIPRFLLMVSPKDIRVHHLINRT